MRFQRRNSFLVKNSHLGPRASTGAPLPSWENEQSKAKRTNHFPHLQAITLEIRVSSHHLSYQARNKSPLPQPIWWEQSETSCTCTYRSGYLVSMYACINIRIYIYIYVKTDRSMQRAFIFSFPNMLNGNRGIQDSSCHFKSYRKSIGSTWYPKLIRNI